MNTSESSQLALVAPSDWRELASRDADGLAVTLLWSKASNQVKVAVADTRLDEAFEVEVAGACGLLPPLRVRRARSGRRPRRRVLFPAPVDLRGHACRHSRIRGRP